MSKKGDGSHLKHGHKVMTDHHNKPTPHLSMFHPSGKEKGVVQDKVKHHKPDAPENTR